MSRQYNQFRMYQIDYAVVASGKMISSSKRRLRWKFGFANMPSLEEGKTGTECRGEEHDVQFVWSLTSGKRLILADGHEVHYSCNRESSFEFTWSMRGNRALKLVAHAFSPGASAANPYAARQYDLFIDGQSFFTLPRVYELGVQGYQPRGHPVSAVAVGRNQAPQYRGAGYGGGSNGYREYNLTTGQYEGPEAPRNSSEEEAALQQAIQKSLEDSKAHLSGPSSQPKPVVSKGAEGLLDLLDFGGPPAPAPAASAPAAVAPPPQVAYDDPFTPKAEPVVSPTNQVLSAYGNSASSPYATDFAQPPAPVPAPAPAVPAAAPVVAYSNNFAQPPPAATYAQTAPQPNYYQNSAPVAPPNLTVDTGVPATQPTQPSPVVQEDPPIVLAPEPASNPVDEVTKGLNSLVNLTDLSSPANNSSSYNPFDLSGKIPETKSSLGPAPTLSEIQKTSKTQSKGPVMKAPPPQQGAMVPHAQQSGYGGYNNSYPAPVGQQTGFGVGAQQMVSPTASYGQQQPMMLPAYGQQQPMMSPTYGQQQHQGVPPQQPYYPPPQY